MIQRPSPARLERSLRYYSWYAGICGAYFWMPVFVLYFSTVVALRQVFLLESIYYATVFALEVPSGYLSDTLGRKHTLLISTACLCASYTLFVIGGSFAVLAAAQALLAAGFACASGTDTSLHYALLAALRREQEYGPREARLAARTRVISAAAAITGGVCAWIGEYRLAYLLSLGAAVYALVLVALVVDPEFSSIRKRAIAPFRQLRAVVDALRTPPLGYLFAFVVAMTALNHVPYEFYQLSVRAVIATLTHERAALREITPLVSGIHLCATMLIGAIGARIASGARDRLGTKSVLLSVALLQLSIVALLISRGSAIVVALVTLRSVPAAVMQPVTRAHVAPLVAPTLRATYFSIQSLAGRLAFALLLVVFSVVPGDGYRSSLVVALAVGTVAVATLALVPLHRDRSRP